MTGQARLACLSLEDRQQPSLPGTAVAAAFDAPTGRDPRPVGRCYEAYELEGGRDVRNNFPIIYILAGLLVAASLLSGCETAQTAEVATIQNGPDLHPRVTLHEARSTVLGNLMPSESIVLASGSDEALVTPNNVLISIRRPLTAEERATAARGRGGAAGEPDAAPRFALSAEKSLLDRERRWHTRTSVDLGSQDAEEPVEFRLVAVNRGNKTFSGDLVIHDHLPTTLLFEEIVSARKVRDQRGARQALSTIPFLGIAAVAMDDYGAAEGSFQFGHDSQDGLLTAHFGSIELRPLEGVLLQFRARLAPADSFLGT